MTFSIVARSADGESWGVAVASKFLAVGSAVPAAVAGVGAIATQASANVAYKGLALSHLDDGATAPVALQRLLEEDDGRDHRQVGIVDVDGNAASHTGEACLDWAGGVIGDGYAIQGNILTGPEVVEAMEAAWLDSSPEATARAPAAGGPRCRRRGRRRLPRPAVGGPAGRQGRGGVRRARRHRGRPAGRRPPRADHRAGPAARAQRPLPHRLDRGGEGAGHRRPPRRARGDRPERWAPRLRRLGRHRELRDAGGSRQLLDRRTHPRDHPRPVR